MKDDERFTQDALSRLTPIEPSAELRRMVAEIPLRHPQKARSLWPFGSFWMPSLSMAAVLALGLLVGRLLSDTMPGEDMGRQASGSASQPWTEDADAIEADLDEGEAELEELLILATAGDFAADDWDLSQLSEKSAPKEGNF